MQHAKRAAFQAGHVWGQSLLVNVITPSPAQWGWENIEGTWSPVWISLGEASKVCRELVKCACKSNCTGRCKCYKSNLPCTQLCACGGQCAREWINITRVTIASEKYISASYKWWQWFSLCDIISGIKKFMQMFVLLEHNITHAILFEKR